MTTTQPGAEPRPMLLSRYLPGLATAGLASLGAGAVHAAAVGIHAEHRDLARIFVVVAALQMGAGIWGLVRPGRAVAWSIVAINAGAVAGWIATRTVGISWIAGLETSESPQFADTTCALMGALAAGAGLFAARVGRQGTRRVRLLLPSLAAIALTIPAMASAGTHVHSHGTAATPSNPAAHSHATAVPANSANAVSASQPHNHTATAAPSVVIHPYDPSRPIDLSGTPGVTPEEQAAAEHLVAITIARLPQWSDYRVALAAGFRSIGDEASGVEHFIQWSWINDNVTLDPDHPESLVYQPQPDGSKKLLSAMYILPATVSLADAPVLGGVLTQWHIHDNLCFTAGDSPQVAGITDVSGVCPAGLQKLPPAPMIHVWIVPNKCGPFAALEGLGAGQIKPGEERLCDHVHGDGLL